MGGAAHFRIVIIASLAGISFGLDTAVIAGAATALRDFFFALSGRFRSSGFVALSSTLLAALIVGGLAIAEADATCSSRRPALT
jgi:hypothetical protein